MARPGPATGGRAADSRTGAVGGRDRADGRVARYRAADVSDSGSSCDRRQRSYRPAARSSPARHANERQPSRLAAGPTIFLIAAPSRRRCRASIRPRASSACGSRPRGLAAAWSPTRPGHRIWPSSCTASLPIILDLGTFIGGGIPMMRDELVGSVVLGAMAALISMLVWGRSLVDVIAAGT